MPSTKTYKAAVETASESGRFEAIVSPFGPPADYQGDVVDPNAYDNEIKRWASSRNRLPLLIAHDHFDESANIGYVESMRAVKDGPKPGLYIVGRLDLQNERAKTIHRLFKERRMVEFSIGYEVLDEKYMSDGSTLLRSIRLIEISVVLKGAAGDANGSRTELLSVKGRKLEGYEVGAQAVLDSISAKQLSDMLEEKDERIQKLSELVRVQTELREKAQQALADSRLTAEQKERRKYEVRFNSRNPDDVYRAVAAAQMSDSNLADAALLAQVDALALAAGGTPEGEKEAARKQQLIDEHVARERVALDAVRKRSEMEAQL